MRKEFDLALQILHSVKNDNVYFGEALKAMFQKNVELRPYRKEVAGLVGCELRHDILFEKLCESLDLTDGEKEMLCLVLANDFYFRHFPKEEIDAELKEALGEEKFALCLPLLEKAGHAESYIPEGIDHSSLEYLSLRYNVPIWALKIMHHFGYSNTYKTIKRFARPYQPFVRLRNVPETDDLRHNEDFTPTSVSDVYAYSGKAALRTLPPIKDRHAYEIRPIVKKLLDDNKVSAPSSVVLYCGKDNGGADKEVIASYLNEVMVNIATPNEDDLLEAKRLIKQLGLRNVNLFQIADPTAMEAYISSKAELVFCLPDSTGFDSVATTPDFFLHYDKERMDQVIANQAKALEGCASYVEDGGTLIYCVLTISKKEGHNAVAEFLSKHSEFTLVEEKQHFPYDEYGCACYYAKLSLGPKVASIAVPFGEMSALTSEPAHCASAK